ncbi:MAG: peptidoglycan DD-metalloendopeptidase family protein, partial [Ruminiclostridium sp.]|nr:peptidoglycan DD-metalloendopeptidase family protein [Ruminiclostridium sp.]
IADKETQIEMLDAQNRKNIERFGQIIHAMYITDSDDYLSIIAGSSDFYDIFVRSEIMKSVKEQNLRFMDQLLADIDRLRSDEAKLEQDKQQLQFDKLTLEQEKDDLIDAKTELDEKVKYYNDLNSGFWTEYNTVTAHINDLETKQANLKYLKKLTQADRDKIQAALEEEIRQAQLRAQNKAVYDTGEWVWPVNTQYHLITTYFGYDKWRGGNHGGIDIGNGGIMGANIYASKGGEVIVAKTTYVPGYDYGMYVVIDHGSGYQTLYAHCSAIYVSVGQMVNKGDCIAAVGSTGWSTGPHLHFEVRKDGSRIDPFSVVNLPQ